MSVRVVNVTVYANAGVANSSFNLSATAAAGNWLMVYGFGAGGQIGSETLTFTTDQGESFTIAGQGWNSAVNNGASVSYGKRTLTHTCSTLTWTGADNQFPYFGLSITDYYSFIVLEVSGLSNVSSEFVTRSSGATSLASHTFTGGPTSDPTLYLAVCPVGDSSLSDGVAVTSVSGGWNLVTVNETTSKIHNNDTTYTVTSGLAYLISTGAQSAVTFNVSHSEDMAVGSTYYYGPVTAVALPTVCVSVS